MAIVERKTKRGIVYWVATSWKGGVAWERIGANRREAERADAARKKEVKAGIFLPRVRSHRATIATYAKTWLARRSNKTAGDDRQRIEDHALTRPWFANRLLREYGLADSMRLVSELQQETSISQKTVKNIWGAVRTMLRDARIERLILEDVTTLPRGVLKPVPKKKRRAYQVSAAQVLIHDKRIQWPNRVLWALVFCTGMREGEACGRRWGDWDRSAVPLGSLDVTTQYGDEPLKVDNPRMVPVHPVLAKVLEDWWSVGFELYVGRPPTRDDFIVPNRSKWRKAAHHTKSSCYKAWRRSLDKVGVANLSLHSTRNTFITTARRHRANPDAIEAITHNAKGDTIDQYTDWQWEPLCEAVMVLPFDAPAEADRTFDAAFDSDQAAAKKGCEMVEAPGIESGGRDQETPSESGESDLADPDDDPLIRRGKPHLNAVLGANQSRRPAAWALGLAYTDVVRRARGRRAA